MIQSSCEVHTYQYFVCIYMYIPYKHVVPNLDIDIHVSSNFLFTLWLNTGSTIIMAVVSTNLTNLKYGQLTSEHMRT